ncbi:hypothetical protein Lepto1489_15025 [Leptospira interrogans serovar Bataviae]|uniref:Uncharacterized protein n=1 Tax=Leptospira interrogans serovar Bataviae TaxID=312175 RepID=A0AAP9WNE4_LEPIR|nr:hypothetical protein Lepto1489_15025 [Leptospira interrogans serovar Bataviae]
MKDREFRTHIPEGHRLFELRSLSQNRPMWELLRKFNDIRTTRKFAKCDLICRNYILLKISKGLSRKIF